MKITIDPAACSHHEKLRGETLWPDRTAAAARRGDTCAFIDPVYLVLLQMVHGLVSLSRRAALSHRICRRCWSSTDFISFTSFTGSL